MVRLVLVLVMLAVMVVWECSLKRKQANIDSVIQEVAVWLRSGTNEATSARIIGQAVKRRRSLDNPSEQDLLDLTTPNCVICNLAVLGIISIYVATFIMLRVWKGILFR